MPEITEAEAREFEALREAERYRRGEPDAKSGAFHVWALTQGSLLKQEYDLSTHGHYDGWVIGALVVDIQRLIAVNQEHGFATGDAVLRAVASTLSERWPRAKVVRIHADAFAVLLPPSAEVALSDALIDEAKAALAQGVPRALERAGKPALELGYHVAMVELTVVSPSHWQVLGPLVWAECERAHVLGRTGQAQGMQKRRVELDAAISLQR